MADQTNPVGGQPIKRNGRYAVKPLRGLRSRYSHGRYVVMYEESPGLWVHLGGSYASEVAALRKRDELARISPEAAP
jgi:hypothetical protein